VVPTTQNLPKQNREGEEGGREGDIGRIEGGEVGEGMGGGSVEGEEQREGEGEGRLEGEGARKRERKGEGMKREREGKEGKLWRKGGASLVERSCCSDQQIDKSKNLWRDYFKAKRRWG